MLRLSSKAQVGIEYMTIFVLVITGILVTGSYVVRSINSYFRTMDNQVTDSFSEELTQSPNVNFSFPCTCNDFTDIGCGASASAANCPSGTPSKPCCTTYQRFWKKFCTPLNCELSNPMGVTEKCQNDLTCCTPWQSTTCGTDGTLPCDATTGCCKNQRKQTRTCGSASATPEIQCIADVACDFSCTGSKPLNSANCTGDTSGLSADTAYTLVAGNTPAIYSNNGTATFKWTGPSSITQMVVKVWGAGGGGGGRQAASSVAGGGGGGGGYSQRSWPLTANYNYTITVGDGGGPTAAGGYSRIVQTDAAGANPTLVIRVAGGTGGNATSGVGGIGGCDGAGTNPITCAGGSHTPGQNGFNRSGANGGNGGDSGGGSPIGQGGAGATNCSGCAPKTGSNGKKPGGGGGGGGDGTNGATVLTGGNGADGRVEIYFGDDALGCTVGTKCEIYCSGSYPSGNRCKVPLLKQFFVAAEIKNDTNDQSAVTSSALCDSSPVTGVFVATGNGCFLGSPSGSTAGNRCDVTLW